MNTKLLTVALACVALAAPALAEAAPRKTAKPTRTASTRAKALEQVKTIALGGSARRKPAATGNSGRTSRRWTYDTWIGRPGAISSVSPIQTSLTLAWAGQTVGYIPQLTIMNAAGPTVERSPATAGAQNVFVYYVIQVWDGRAWTHRRTHTASATIPAGYGATRTPALVNQPQGLSGFVRVVVGVVHRTPAGEYLGLSVIVPTTADDQFCNGGVRCTTYNGYLRLGG